jgi:hypothetical protein
MYIYIQEGKRGEEEMKLKLESDLEELKQELLTKKQVFICIYLNPMHICINASSFQYVFVFFLICLFLFIVRH